MTREELVRAVLERGAFWVNVMNLNHWRIDVMVVDALTNEDALASCTADNDYDSATIKIRYDLEEHQGDDQSLDYIIVHELLHIHLRDLDETFLSTVGRLGSIGDGYRSRWDHEEEGLIDRLARAIIDLEKVVPSESNESTT